MVSCVFPGSFDPVTVGHLNLIARASAMFDRVTVTLMVNKSKTGRIPFEVREKLLRKVCGAFGNVTVDTWDGLLADYMKTRKEKTVIRGLRDASEFDREYGSFCANRFLNGETETLFIPCDPAYTGVSSSAVREIASFGGDISSFVPEEVREEIAAWLSK